MIPLPCFLLALQNDGARQFPILDLGNLLLYRGQLLLTRPRRQDVSPVLGQPGEDRRHLRRSLALTENHFRHPVAQRAMVIHLGEPKVLEGKMPQALDPVVGRKLAPSHLLEKFADGIGVQE